MSTVTAPSTSTKEWLKPVCLVVAFTVVLQGLSLSEFLPLPVALLIGAGWGIAIGLLATWLGRKPSLRAWLEDGFVFLGTVVMAFAACSVLGLLMIDSALDSSSLSGETLLAIFVPSIPYFIVVNSVLELLIIPFLLVLGWRAGPRRLLIVAAAGMYFVQRVWTYLVFASARLDFADQERSTAPLTAAEREQARADLMLDDPRWILNLIIFVVFLLAAHLPRLRDARAVDRPG